MSLLDGKSTHGRDTDRLERAHSAPKIEEVKKSYALAEADEFDDPVYNYDDPDESAAREAAATAQSICGRMCKFSRVYDAEKEMQLPKFERSELVLGKMLGKGGFSDVYEIRAIHLKKNGVRCSSIQVNYVENANNTDSEDEEFFDRKFLSKHAIRKSGESRYAIKYLSPDITSGDEADRDRFITGAVDIALEIKFLSSFEHPNIVKMRGLSSRGLAGFAQTGGFFLIIDRLYDILESRLSKWHKTHPKYRGDTLKAKVLSPFSRNKAREAFVLRLLKAYDIASALEYLHYRNIIYRDLKPDNVGFDIRDDVKIFDLGLARELSQVPDEVGPNNLPMYEMTPNTGTQRYMAPEVSTGKPYNLSADTYSFGILLWQMLKIEIPFKGMGKLTHIETVMKGSVRPKIKKIWPPKIQQLIERCWDGNMFERPSMPEVTKILKSEIISLTNPGEEAQEMAVDMRKDRRRSTHVGKMVKTFSWPSLRSVVSKEDVTETTTRM